MEIFAFLTPDPLVPVPGDAGVRLAPVVARMDPADAVPGSVAARKDLGDARSLVPPAMSFFGFAGSRLADAGSLVAGDGNGPAAGRSDVAPAPPLTTCAPARTGRDGVEMEALFLDATNVWGPVRGMASRKANAEGAEPHGGSRRLKRERDEGPEDEGDGRVLARGLRGSQAPGHSNLVVHRPRISEMGTIRRACSHP